VYSIILKLTVGTFRNTSRHASNKEVSGGTYNSKQFTPYIGMQPPFTVEGAVGLLVFCLSYLNHVQLAKGLKIWMVKGANPFHLTSFVNVSTNISNLWICVIVINFTNI
jgi:hypothetical protein